MVRENNGPTSDALARVKWGFERLTELTMSPLASTLFPENLEGIKALARIALDIIGEEAIGERYSKDEKLDLRPLEEAFRKRQEELSAQIQKEFLELCAPLEQEDARIREAAIELSENPTFVRAQELEQRIARVKLEGDSLSGQASGIFEELDRSREEGARLTNSLNEARGALRASEDLNDEVRQLDNKLTNLRRILKTIGGRR